MSGSDAEGVLAAIFAADEYFSERVAIGFGRFAAAEQHGAERQGRVARFESNGENDSDGAADGDYLPLLVHLVGQNICGHDDSHRNEESVRRSVGAVPRIMARLLRLYGPNRTIREGEVHRAASLLRPSHVYQRVAHLASRPSHQLLLAAH